ncbi:MAG: hypothetical protein AAF153_02335, partial [Pseudomonadota bacterium]
MLSSCTRDYYSNSVDDELNLTRNDIRKLIYNEEARKQKEAEINLPDIEPIIAKAKAPDIKNDRKVSLAISNDVDVKDVLLEMARLAELDIELDPEITAGIILQVNERPITEVVERICDLANLRYSVDRGVLRIERDRQYFENYHLDFINLVRSNSGSLNVSVGLDSSGDDTGSSQSSGSSSTIDSSYEGDLWQTIEDNITQIISVSNASTPAVVTAANNTASASDTSGTNLININREANTINVYADNRSHKAIKAYLKQVKRYISAQANIEVKIVEVALKDEFKSGIDWQMFKKFAGRNSSFNLTENPISGEFTNGAGNIEFQINTENDSLFNIVNMLNVFGLTRTLSSPRINAMNNQQAILSFAKNQVYYELDVSNISSTEGNNTSESIDSTLKTVPIGLILNLQPSINPDTDEITMNVRPTISRVVDNVSDPSVSFALTNIPAEDRSTITNSVPVVEVKEIDSILKVKSGHTMVIGGMMEERSLSYESGLPFASELPIAGNLFKSRNKTTSTIQTIIFIKATIVDSSAAVSEDDKKIYRGFSRRQGRRQHSRRRRPPASTKPAGRYRSP